MFGLFKKKKSSRPVYLVSAAIIIAVIAISLSSILVTNSGKPANSGNYTGNSSNDVVNGIALDNDPMLGASDAKVTIVEFSEFVCPYCGRFARDTLPQIKANYIDTGKVRLVFRDYILHESAQIASEASECAYEQGNEKYWLFSEKLFNNQGALTSNDLKRYAAELGLDKVKFDECLDSGKYKTEVDKDTADGKLYGVSGTPTFFINGKKFVGAQPYAKFQAEIDAALGA